MAFTSEVLGFEGGDGTGITLQTAGSVTAAAARTGSYGLRSAPVGAAASYGGQIGQGIPGIASGAKHAAFGQFQYRMAAGPNVNTAPLCGYADFFYITVNIDLTATLHVAGIGSTAISIPTPTSLLWFRVQFRQWTTNVTGTLFGTDVKHFLVVIDYTNDDGVVQFISSAGLSALNVGFTSIEPLTLGATPAMGGALPTWTVDFDDCIYVAATDTDVDDFVKWSALSMGDYAASIFRYDKVYPVLITGQGPNSGFSGPYTDVNEVPKGAGQITGVGSGTWTDYLHQTAPGTNIEGVTLRVNANVSILSTQALTVDTVETAFTFRDSGSSNATSPFTTSMYPTTLLGNFFTPAQFSAQVFGVKCKDANTITLRNIYLEVLSGDPYLATVDTFPVTAEIFPEFVTGATEEDLTFTGSAPGFRLSNQGEEINVPTTWRLERFDIGPRREEKA